MRVRTAAAALSLVVALTGCDGEGNGSSPTHETPTSVPSSTASPATTLPPEATTGPSAATLGDTTEPPTASTTIGTSTTAVVPAGYQWWDASPDGFAVAVPEAWVIHGALDAETMQQLGVDPDVIALEAPLFLAYNPANRDEELSVGVFPAPGTGMYEGDRWCDRG